MMRHKKRENTNGMCPELCTAALLGALTLFFCWLFIGRFGVFGSKVDWISQHSVIPEYFRQQFYETGDFFPEFAPNIGGGQNIYNFSYYGLYSPVILLSYLFPAVKMGDYIMMSSICMAALSSILFYLWLRSRDLSRQVSFWSALMLELSGPMIFHSARHIMFVNYMPFLIMALWGIDRYFGNPENIADESASGKAKRRSAKRGMGRTFSGNPWLYIAGVFLMILTSFYFSVGGILVLSIYGLHRYAQVRREQGIREKSENLCVCANGYGVRRKGMREARGLTGIFRYFYEAVRFGRDAAAFLIPVLTAVCMSAFLLIPTAYALAGKRDTVSGLSFSALLTPDFYDFRLFYNSYGIGLTSFAAVALLAALFWKRAENRILILSCIAVLILPVFPWILNGGLYPRDKALIPFLPLFSYVTALYAKRMQIQCRNNDGAKSYKNVLGAVPYAAVIALLLWQTGYSISDWTKVLTSLPQRLLSGGTISFRQQRALLILDAFLMLLFYAVFRWRKNIRYLIVPPTVFLAVFGLSVHGAANVVSRTLYDRVTNEQIEAAIEETLSSEDGFYRMEQCGSMYEENMANVNRIWSMDQYISSIYSSSYHDEYRNFCRERFGIEEPTRNALIQQASQNPSFRRLMGVKYIVMQDAENVSQSRQRQQLLNSGYELCYNKDGVQIYQNEDVSPVGYVTENVITRDTYEKLAFPYNQIVLEHFAVTEAALGRTYDLQQEKKRVEEVLSNDVQEISLLFPKEKGEKWNIIPVQDDKNRTVLKNADSKVWLKESAEGTNSTHSKKAEPKVDYYEATSYHVKTEGRQEITIRAAGAEEFVQPWVLYLQFTVKNARPSSDVSISVDGIKNKLSASTHLYKNENTVFTYAVPMQAGQAEAEMVFDRGEYDILDIRCFAKQENHQQERNRVYADGKKTGWMPDKDRSIGNKLTGAVCAEKTEWFITSIPYDKNFEILIDGINTVPGIVNTAFLGFMIPEGEHTVTFVYHAPGLALGKIVSVLGSILCVLLLLFCNRKKVMFMFKTSVIFN